MDTFTSAEQTMKQYHPPNNSSLDEWRKELRNWRRTITREHARDIDRTARDILESFRSGMLDILEEDGHEHIIESIFWRFYAPEDADLTIAEEYAEPGMDDPENGKSIIIALKWYNWPRDLDVALENLGYQIEWADQVIDCQECGRIVYQHATSMAWRPHFVWYLEPGAYYNNDPEFLCLDCARENIDAALEDARENATGELPDEHTARELVTDLEYYADHLDLVPEDGLDRGNYHIMRDFDNAENLIASYDIGSCLHLAPSGKYYLPFACSNVDPCPYCEGKGTIGSEFDPEECPICRGEHSLDVLLDQEFYTALDDGAEKLDGFITSGEGCGTDLIFQICHQVDALTLGDMVDDGEAKQ